MAFPRLTLEVSVEQFFENVLEQQGVMIVPGSLFEFTGNHFRVGLEGKNLPEVLERVAE